MSDVPPPNEPNEPPSAPPQFAAYPRGPEIAPYGSFEKLQALSDGYFGLNNVFLVNVLLAIGSRALQLGPRTPEQAWMMIIGAVVVMGLIIGVMSFPFNRKIAIGKGWTDGHAILASVLMGLNSALCCGLIGYIVMQSIASSEMKKYGISAAGLGLKKKVVQERIAQMKAQQGSGPMV
jgi:hypothetical protein